MTYNNNCLWKFFKGLKAPSLFTFVYTTGHEACFRLLLFAALTNSLTHYSEIISFTFITTSNTGWPWLSETWVVLTQIWDVPPPVSGGYQLPRQHDGTPHIYVNATRISVMVTLYLSQGHSLHTTTSLLLPLVVCRLEPLRDLLLDAVVRDDPKIYLQYYFQKNIKWEPYWQERYLI